mmetsp:Transcript_33490/g.50652  ORF Transcript_33490/g.50652 Transcript_33490/m.50652 type:complete len:120 (-) Transcript_33490:31-390(-)
MKSPSCRKAIATPLAHTASHDSLQNFSRWSDWLVGSATGVSSKWLYCLTLLAKQQPINAASGWPSSPHCRVLCVHLLPPFLLHDVLYSHAHTKQTNLATKSKYSSKSFPLLWVQAVEGL